MSGKTISQADIAAYEAYLRGEGKAESTIENYLREVQAFRRWVGRRSVIKTLVADWKEYLLANSLAPATVNAKLAAVNSLLQFLSLKDCQAKAVKIQRRVFRDASRELTKDEYRRLLEAANSLGQDRLALLTETIGATGVRVSEVRYITVEAARNQRADIRLKGKIRSILLPQKLCRKLLKYAKRRKISSGAIFRTKSGSPISRGQIWREMKTLAEKAGVTASKVFPHNLRHLFATVFYRASQDIVKLADLLGHSSINTTRIYLISTGVEHARQIERLGLLL